MKETFYFSHDYNAQSDEKILELRMDHGREGYGIYWAIIERLASNKGKLNISKIKSIAFDMQIDNTLITELLHNYNLFIVDEKNGIFYNERLLQHFEKRDNLKQTKSEAGKKGMAKRWGKHNTVITENNTVITKHNKGKENKGKENKIISKDITTDVEEFGNIDINNMQKLIKQTIENNNMLYKPGKYERLRIKNIITGKEFGKVCEKCKMSREEFVINIINLASKLQYCKAINNGVELYANYADVYNKALKTKNNILQPKRLIG